MFKGPIKVASHTTISNKDRKKLKKDLYKGFPTDVIDAIFENTADFSATKLQGVPFTIYSEEDAPLFVDSTGNGDLFPTVYAIDFYPDLCRNIYLKEGVEAFVFKGANLMWPGVADLESLPADLNVDDVIAIRKSGDNTVVAIGALASEP